MSEIEDLDKERAAEDGWVAFCRNSTPPLKVDWRLTEALAAYSQAWKDAEKYFGGRREPFSAELKALREKFPGAVRISFVASNTGQWCIEVGICWSMDRSSPWHSSVVEAMRHFIPDWKGGQRE